MPTYPRSNQAIALLLIKKFAPLIEGIVWKMGVRYRLSAEDRQDLTASIHAKIGTIKWRAVIRKSEGKTLDNYCISVVQNSAIKECRRIQAFGLSGLSGNNHPITSYPQEDDTPQQESGADGLASKMAATEMAERARKILPKEEWEVLSLLHGFDGGGSRTMQQVARELKKPCHEVALYANLALSRLRETVEKR